MSGQIFIKRPSARIREFKNLPENNDNVIRVWCEMYPDVYNFQIRTFAPINGPFGEGKPRNMIATVHVTIEEVEEILRQMKAYKAGEPSAFDHKQEPQESEEAKPPFPSFFATHGRKPIAGKDYDPEGSLCQDDYEYLSGTGRYSDNVSPK